MPVPPVPAVPDRTTVARWDTVASRPHHSAASTTSPSTLTHSASAPAGTSAWSIPGATLSTTRDERSTSPATNVQGGE